MSKGFKLKKLTVTMVFSVLFFFVGLRMNDVEAATYSGTANGKSLATIKTQTDATSYCSCGKSIGTTGHWCCWNYASNAYAKIWGTSFARSDNNNLLKNVAAADRKFTAANLKKYLAFAQPGANLRIDSSSTATAGDSNGHSLIFCGMDSAGDGAYFLEGNYDGKGHTRLADVKFSSLVNTYSSYGYTYIKYIMWPGGSSVNMSAPVISNIKVTGWTDGQVDIECDITAPSGISKAEISVWPKDVGTSVAKYLSTYTVSGNHYKFSLNPELLYDGKVGTFRSNIFAWDKNGTRTMTSSPVEYTMSKHTTHNSSHWKYVGGSSATCTAAGVVSHYKCILCGKLDRDTYIAPLGHNYVKSETKATCTTAGSSIEKCSRCSATRNSTSTPALGHNYVKSETKATCTTAGSSIEKCSRCSATRNATTTPALGHNMGSYVSNNDATTKQDGTKTRKCTRCTYNETVTDVGSRIVETLIKEDGKWYYTRGGKKDPTYTGLVKYNNIWWYVKDGKLNTTETLVKYNSTWWYVKDGKLNNTETLVKYNGIWWHVKDGKLNNAETLVKYNGTWWYVKDGKLNTSETLVKYNGTWWYVKDGKLNTSKTLVKYNGTWWYVKDGKLNTSETLVKYNNKWWYVKNGKLNTTETLVKYNDKWWYVKDGKVDFTKTGNVNYNGHVWYVKEGVMQNLVK